MGKQVDVDDLVGAEELAVRLDVARPQVIHEWRRRYQDFPEPVFKGRRVYVWDWNDVKDWASRTGRLPVPGPKARRSQRRSS